jgi:hypothetical protein
MRLSTLAFAFLAAACGTALTSRAAQALEVSTSCTAPQALSQALKDEGQTLIIVGNQLVRKAGSPDVADYAMRAVYLNPETGQGYVVTGNVPFDPTGATQQPITCSSIEMKLDNARIYNQASKEVSASALVPGDRSAALAFCARLPVEQPPKPCEFHNDAVSDLVKGGGGLMFQGAVTASTSTVQAGSIVSLFLGRADNTGLLTYTAGNGVLRYGAYLPFIGYTEKGSALLGKRKPQEVASLN